MKIFFSASVYLLLCVCLLAACGGIRSTSHSQPSSPTMPSSLQATSVSKPPDVPNRIALAALHKPRQSDTITDTQSPSNDTPPASDDMLPQIMLDPLVAHDSVAEVSPTYPPGTTVADIDIGNLTMAEAASKLRIELEPVTQPLCLYIGTTFSTTITAEDIGLSVPIDDMLLDAYYQTQVPDSVAPVQPVRMPLHIEYDATTLNQRIMTLAEQTTISPMLTVVTDTIPIDSNFARMTYLQIPGYTYTPQQTIDVQETLEQIEAHLHKPHASHTIQLKLHATSTPSSPPRVSLAEIQHHFETLANQWTDGIVGVYLYDLATGEHIGINERTVFSGASTMKAAILLHAYVRLPWLTQQHQYWRDLMIIHSDNIAANNMLAASVGGYTNSDAYIGTLEMSRMLQNLGFEHTYQHGPYAITPPEYIGVDYEHLYPVQSSDDPPPPPEDYDLKDADNQPYSSIPQEGNPPYTNADTSLRTTPAEMSRVYLLINECRSGGGMLLNLYSKTLSPERCQEMLDVLAQNGDTNRMRAGLPPDTRVEHKSGWIDDMQADAGIVRTPGGDFILAVFVYGNLYYLEDSVAHPLIASFAHVAYTAYNPTQVKNRWLHLPFFQQ